MAARAMLRPSSEHGEQRGDDLAGGGVAVERRLPRKVEQRDPHGLATGTGSGGAGGVCFRRGPCPCGCLCGLAVCVQRGSQAVASCRHEGGRGFSLASGTER